MNKELAFQLRSLRDNADLSQEELAAKVGMTQNAISRLENPRYGKATLTTLKRLAATYDVGLVVRFVPFSKLVNWVSGAPYVETGLSPESMDVPTYEEEIRHGAFEIRTIPAMASVPTVLSSVTYKVDLPRQFNFKPLSFMGSFGPVAMRVPFSRPTSEPEQDLWKAPAPHDTSWITENVLKMLVPEQPEALVSSPIPIEQIRLTGENDYQVPVELVAAANKSCSAKIAGAE